MLGAVSCGAMQLRGRISVVPGGQDSPGLIGVARSAPGCAESARLRITPATAARASARERKPVPRLSRRRMQRRLAKRADESLFVRPRTVVSLSIYEERWSPVHTTPHAVSEVIAYALL